MMSLIIKALNVNSVPLNRVAKINSTCEVISSVAKLSNDRTGIIATIKTKEIAIAMLL